MITTEPPAERDVSPARHAELRAAAMRRLTGPKRPGWALPAIAAAVTAALIAGIAAVPALRHEKPTPPSPPTRPALPGLMIATYFTVKDKSKGPTGLKVFDPASGTYRILDSWNGTDQVSPDLRWRALITDSFDDIRIVPVGADVRAGKIDPKVVKAWGPHGEVSRWSSDGSRYYLGVPTRSGVRMLGIDPATRAVVSSTDLAIPGAAGQHGVFLSSYAHVLTADPRAGFFVLLESGVLCRFSPTGRPLGTRKVPIDRQFADPGSLTVVSPDGARVAVTELGDAVDWHTHIIDLRTGAEVLAEAPGSVAQWVGADYYLSLHGNDLILVDARTGKQVGHSVPRPKQDGDSMPGLLIPYVGTAPKGAVTITF